MSAAERNPQLPILKPTVVAFVGPTAAGKTAIGIAVAEKLGAEIVSADSRYLYIGLDIGTAKPSGAERARVRHHLIDVTTPDRPWSLTIYQQAALAAIAEIHSHGRLPLLVGGTGQYIRAITEGWQAPPGDSSGQVRLDLEAGLRATGVDALADRLRQVDPTSAAKVDVKNPRRVVRALEVALTTGQSFTAQRRKSPPPFQIILIGLSLPRPELYRRIDARVEAMLAAGLVDEVQRLVAAGYAWDLPAMTALGYRQIGEYLRGECDLAEAVRRIKSDTRKFVRRQANWFKPRDPNIHWLDVTQAGPAEIVEYLGQRLAS